MDSGHLDYIWIKRNLFGFCPNSILKYKKMTKQEKQFLQLAVIDQLVYDDIE